MTNKEKIRDILFKFSSPYDRKTVMLHQDNFSGASDDLEAFIREREGEAVEETIQDTRGYLLDIKNTANGRHHPMIDDLQDRLDTVGFYCDDLEAYLEQKEAKE